MTLQQILLDEEVYWQRRGGEKWILEGDSNTSFFHKCANGRRRKMRISTFEHGDITIVDPKQLREHVTEYYKSLFGRAETVDIHLVANMWNLEHQTSQDENEWLTRPFTLNELHNVVKEIKGNTASGPDGFTIEFFKTF
jgi:hypothetical protein